MQGNTHMHDYLPSYFIDEDDYSFWQDPHVFAWIEPMNKSVDEIIMYLEDFYAALPQQTKNEINASISLQILVSNLSR